MLVLFSLPQIPGSFETLPAPSHNSPSIVPSLPSGITHNVWAVIHASWYDGAWHYTEGMFLIKICKQLNHGKCFTLNHCHVHPDTDIHHMAAGRCLSVQLKSCIKEPRLLTSSRGRSTAQCEDQLNQTCMSLAWLWSEAEDEDTSEDKDGCCIFKHHTGWHLSDFLMDVAELARPFPLPLTEQLSAYLLGKKPIIICSYQQYKGRIKLAPYPVIWHLESYFFLISIENYLWWCTVHLSNLIMQSDVVGRSGHLRALGTASVTTHNISHMSITWWLSKSLPISVSGNLCKTVECNQLCRPSWCRGAMQ